MMKVKHDEVKTTIRIYKETMDKLEYIAEYYGRSKNKEIDWAIKQHIFRFEEEYGKIILDVDD
ncbi:MAG: TraY domain-containing protein [Agathobaculum desmolans]|jgi:predicted DNA-binding protein|uniref:TraY domain-containing protein n=1 Tax=Agathobaculum desmolans TaxID=39484 RepID=UPI0004E11D36|nr:TraY domain-containing protein [Agathobaculum desmolans]